MSNPLGDLISKGEGNYNSFNRGNAGDSRGQTIDFSQMTLGEVQTAQHLGRHDPHRLFAVGKYQIIPDTMDDAARQLKLDPSQKFTPDLQERIFADYLIAGKRPQIEAYIKGEPGATLHAAQKAACQEWASVEDPDTPGKPYAPYLKHGNNHSSITSGQIAGALNTMRAEYQVDTAKGIMPDEAWEAVTRSMASSEQAAPKHASHLHTAHGHHALEQGVRGTAVHTLQVDLAKLGYAGSDSKPLRADGDFGLDTRRALERFQHDHHLTVDGIAGPKTLKALDHAQAQHVAPNLADPKNPDHALYEQALAGVCKLDANLGRQPDLQSAQLAAGLVVAAKREGLSHIDNVMLSEDGSRAFAVQGGTNSPLRQFAHVQTADAVNTPMTQSATAAAQIRSPEPTPTPNAPALAQTGPTMSM